MPFSMRPFGRFPVQCAVSAIVLAVPCFNLEAASRSERESLRGLEGVQLVIQDIEQDAKADGLSEDKIRTAVEGILRSSDIRILDDKDQDAPISTPWLYVQTATLKSPMGRYACIVRLSLRQRVILAGALPQSMSAVTWESGIWLGNLGASNLRHIIEIVERKTKEFASDFLAENRR
jgi:hypothetical protein